MSLTTPSSAPVVPTVNAGVIPVGFRPYSDITSFTYRTGMTHMALVENMRVWIQKTLIPFLNDNFSEMEEAWEIEVNTLVAAVNTALVEQTSDNTQKIADALTAISEANIQITDPGVLAVLEDASSAVRGWLDEHYVSKAISDALSAVDGQLQAQINQLNAYYAPAPSGGDDTAALQPLLLAAQATEGALILRKGTYLVNLATINSFQQPRILGQGRDQTILKAFSNTSPVLRLKGGAGKLSGGFLADFTIHAADAGGGIGLQLADPGGVKWTRLKFDGTLAEGIQFLSESSGAFCEFNSGDAYFKGAVVLPVHYKRTLGNESFHGSGVTQGTVFETLNTSTSPVIVIDSNCFVYGAPLTASFFPAASNVPLIRNLNTGRTASLYGHLDIEAGPGTSGIAVVDPAQKGVYFHGTVGALTSGTGLTPGGLIRTHKTYYIGTNAYASAEPYSSTVPITANPTTIVRKPGVALINVEIRQGANYLYSYLLHFWPNPFNAGGVVTVLANPQSLNPAAFGPPVFSINNGQLVITNANYPLDGSVVAYVSVNPQNVSYASDTFNYS